MTSVLSENGFYGFPLAYNTQKSPLLHGDMAWKYGRTESPKNSLLKLLSIEGKPLELFSESINGKIELYRIVSWSGRRWRGWCLWTGRTATWSAAPCSTPTSAQSSGRCCTRPGAISTLYLSYIYIISTLYLHYLLIIYYYLQVGSGPAAAGRVPGP